MMRSSNPEADARRRRLAADLDAFRRRGGEIRAHDPHERAGTRGDRDNSHIFGYRKR